MDRPRPAPPSVRGLSVQFTPGTRYAYSNDGFFVLGAIVAAVTGQSYFDYIRQHVFAPAGMTRTDFHSRPQVLADNAIATRRTAQDRRVAPTPP